MLDVIIIYKGSTKADGGVRPMTTSLMMPPANPAVPDRTTTPTMSSLCSMAFRAPVTANIIVPKRSKKWTGIDDTIVTSSNIGRKLIDFRLHIIDRYTVIMNKIHWEYLYGEIYIY